MKRKIYLIITVLITIILCLLTTKILATEEIKLNLVLEKDEVNNNVSLRWELINSEDDYEYKVYSQKEESDEYITVGTNDYESGDKIRVLNVYPYAGNTLKTWMETNGYGRGIITVDPIDIGSFNNNPGQYLGTSGNWKYDVIMFGTRDSNNGCDISASARILTEQFINDGKGAIFGHDTIGMSGGNLTHPNFTALAKYVNITMGAPWSVDSGNNQVVITKKGIFTTFPWNIGEVGDVLNIPWAHHLDQYANGDIWLKFKDREQANFYLTTWNNCAMIQTGHSSGAATQDEQKIIANLIGFVKQTTTKTYAKDYSGMDVNGPDALQNVQTEFNSNGDLEITFDDVKDNGSVYNYYVEGKNTQTKETIKSNTETIEITTGLKGYSYVIDDNETIASDFFKGREVVSENKIVVSNIDITKGTYLHIAAVDNADNVSEVSNIKLQYRYKTKIELVSKLNNDEKIADAVVEVITKNEDGEIISEQEAITDENGLIEAKHDLNFGTKLIHQIYIKEFQGPYLIDKGMEIEVDVDDVGNITGKDLENNQELINNNSEKSITGVLALDNKKVEIEIEKVDRDNENIRLENAEIKIGEETITTDEEGKGSSLILAREKGVYEYTIEETGVPVGYNGIEGTKIHVAYDVNGDVEGVFSESEEVEVKGYEKENIKLEIKNNKKEVEGYKIQVEAIDIDNESKKVKEAKYRIEINADSGEMMEIEQETDENGQIEIPKLGTIGETRIKITQIESAEGYKKEEGTRYVTIERKENGEIIGIAEKTSEEEEVSIIGNKIVKIIEKNKAKEEENRIVIEVGKGEEIIIEELKFRVEDEYGVRVEEGKTDEKGRLIIEDVKELGEGYFIYKITPEENNIYGIGEIRIVVTYDKEGRIVKAEEITTEATEVKVEKEEDAEKKYTDAHVVIEVKEEEEEGKQKIKIIKEDKREENKKLSGATYNIRQKTSTSIKTVKKRTDTFGEINVNVIEAEEVELKIKEIGAPSKYIIDNTEKTIKLGKNTDTGLMEVIEKDSGVEVTTDERGNIVITEKNEKKIEEGRDAKANICFFLTKKDKRGSLLGNVEFTLTEEKTGRTYDLVTDANGYVELHDFGVPGEGTYEFYIQEKNTISGYDTATVPIKLIISYEEYEGEMKTSQILVARGYKYIEYKRCDEYETEDKYQLDVIMTIVNEGIPDLETKAAIETKKVDEETGKEVTGAKYEVTVEYENGTSIRNRVKIEELEEVIGSINVENGEKATIKFKEVEAPVGYEIKTEEESVVVRRQNGILKIISKTTNKANIIDNEIISITLADKKKEEQGIITKNAGREEEGYTIRVENKNVYNDKIRMEGSVFNTKIEQKGEIVYNADRGLERNPRLYNTVEYGQIKIDGEQRIEIKQIVAPIHHEINDTEYTIEIERTAIEGKIELKRQSEEKMKVAINNEERTITVVIENEPSEIIMAIEKVDAADQSIGLGNVGFKVGIYKDDTAADLRTEAYIKTADNGIGSETISSFVTRGTALYTIEEAKTPEGYYNNGTIGVYITTNRSGNITAASTIENSRLFDSGKCTIVQKQGKYIELKIKNERKPEPTYSVVVENENKYDRLTKVAGSEFKITVEQEKGANIVKTVGTGGDGRAVLGDLNGKGKIKISIEQTQAGRWYKKDSEIKTVEVEREIVQTVGSEGNTYAKRISLKEKTPTEVEVTVDSEKQEIKVKVINERAYGIEIEKVDIEDKTKYLSGAKFELYEGETKVGEVTTNDYGTGYMYLGDAPINQTKKYTLREVEAPKGYEEVGEWEIELEFNEVGEKEKETVTGENIEVVKSDKGYLRLRIIEPKEETAEEGEEGGKLEAKETTSELKIIKEGVDNRKLKIEKVVFDIKVEAEDGRGFRAIKTTDKRGIIELGGIPGDKFRITIKEIEAGKGYVIDDKERTIVVKKIKDKDGKDIIKLVKEETSEDIDIQIDETTRKIQVTYKNRISEGNMGLAIVQEDSEDELLTIEGAIYEVKDEETNEIYQITTGEEGIGQLILEKKKEAGVYRFKIKEKEAPEGYKIEETEMNIEIEVEKDEAGNTYIKTGRIIAGGEIAEIKNQDRNYIEIHIKNEPKEGIEPYAIKVIKVDRDDIGITLPEALVRVDIENSVGQTGLSKMTMTDDKGEININNVRGAGDVEIDLTEIVPPEGRKFDLKEKKAKLTRDPNTGRIKLIDSINVDTIIDNKKKLITVLVRNEIVDGQYTLVVEKSDYQEPKMKLSNVKMKILIPGEIEEREVVTDEEGRIVITNLPIPQEGEYTYKITEIETIEGYKKLDEEVEFKIKFEEMPEREEITEGKITKGKNAKVMEQLPKYIRIGIYNEQEENGEGTYKVTLKKKDAEDENVAMEGTKIKLKIKYENGEARVIETETDEEGKIEIKGLVTKGIAKITVEEKEAIEGYDLDTEEKEVKVRIEDINNMTIEEKEEGIEAEIKDREIALKITNERSKEYKNLHIEKYISRINERETEEERAPKVEIGEEGKVKYTKAEGKEKVKVGDEVEFTLRVYNDGTEGGYAETIRDELPEGLEYIEDNEINKANEWNQVEEKVYETKILSKEKGEEKKIEGYDAEKGISYKEAKIVLKVVEKGNNEAETENIAIIKDITEGGVYKQDNGEKEEFDIAYVKLKVEKKAKKIRTTVEGETREKEAIEDGINKIEIYRKDIEKTEIEIEYEIKVTNEGTIAAKEVEIKDKIPEGMEIVEEKSEGWTGEGKYILEKELEPGESVTKTIVLKCKGNNIGTKTNVAEVEYKGKDEEVNSGIEDKKQEGKKDEEATVIVSIKTGSPILYAGMTIGALGLLGAGIFIIKRKVL